MSIQNIIDNAQNIEIDRRRVVGQTISRSERIKSAERASAQALKLTVSPQARFRYSEYRSVLENIQSTDRFQEQTVNLGQSHQYLTQYQGSLTPAQLNTMTVSVFTGTSVTFTNLPSVTSGTVIFKAGDWIQPAQSRYPYIITSQVSRGSLSVITATVHRSLITSESTTTTGTFFVGTATTIRVLVSDLPTFKTVQKDWAEWTGDFILVEKII